MRAASGTAPGQRESILHVDMDAFYASVEIRERPELGGLPVIVAGLGNRGVVTAASYEARRYGVHSAMPTVRARRLCPEGVFLSPDHALYAEESGAIRRIFESFTPLVEPISLDEAFLDVRGAERLFGDAVSVGRAIRERIAAERHLPASVGIGTTKLIAKLASRAAKPDGLLRVPAGSESDFLWPLPVEELWGVGKATLELLDRLGIRTVGDLSRVPPGTLERVLGVAHGRHLHELAHARDPSPVVVTREPKSVGHEQTFPVDLSDHESIVTELLRLSDRVSRRLRRSGHCARTITLKCRLASFRTLTRAITVDEPVDATPELHAIVMQAFERLRLERPAIRLLGVSASGLREGGPNRQLRFEAEPHWQAVMEATDAIVDRWGDGAVGPARLLRDPGPHPNRRVHSIGTGNIMSPDAPNT